MTTPTRDHLDRVFGPELNPGTAITPLKCQLCENEAGLATFEGTLLGPECFAAVARHWKRQETRDGIVEMLTDPSDEELILGCLGLMTIAVLAGAAAIGAGIAWWLKP